MKLTLAFTAFVFCAFTVWAQGSHLSPERKYPIVRLPPTAFPELPKNLVTELKRRGCTIPQVAGFNKRQNVVRGEFAKPGQIDWAMLCYSSGFLGLYVFWRGSEADMATVNRRRFPEAIRAEFETVIAPSESGIHLGPLSSPRWTEAPADRTPRYRMEQRYGVLRSLLLQGKMALTARSGLIW
jgi:hypothetical protein